MFHEMAETPCLKNKNEGIHNINSKNIKNSPAIKYHRLVEKHSTNIKIEDNISLGSLG